MSPASYLTAPPRVATSKGITVHWLLVSLAMAAAAPGAPAQALVSGEGVRAAQAWVTERDGSPSFAVIGRGGRLRGHRMQRTYPAASVAKAMLLVAVLRDARTRELTGEERALLRPMITQSKNPPARTLYARHGAGALEAVARDAGMTGFTAGASLFESRTCAADQARLFLRIDRLMPRRHRRYGRWLLANLIEEHRWGIPEAAAAQGLRALAKGGWRSDVVHQAALVERTHRERVALAVLTASTSQNYGRNTVAGVARRVLR